MYIYIYVYIYIYIHAYVCIYVYTHISRPRGDRKFGDCCFWVAWAATSMSQFRQRRSERARLD